MLLWACTPLPDEREQGGVVIVFDDITALLAAQRDAAWGEVARRLAHEIKNPLTPIQLSAERLRRKLLGGMNAEDAQLLERATHTIVQQVDAMKQMVNAFSEYARAPDMKLQHFNLNQLVTEVAELYRLQDPSAEIRLDLDPGPARNRGRPGPGAPDSGKSDYQRHRGPGGGRAAAVSRSVRCNSVQKGRLPL